MLLDGLDAFLRSLGIPLGGMLIGFALGGGLFATAEWLRHRPSSSIVGTVRVQVARDPAAAGATPPGPPPTDARRVVPVKVSTATRSLTVFLRGAGASPNAPLPRARVFMAVLAAVFVAVSALELAFFSALFLPYDHLVGVRGRPPVLAVAVAGGLCGHSELAPGPRLHLPDVPGGDGRLLDRRRARLPAPRAPCPPSALGDRADPPLRRGRGRSRRRLLHGPRPERAEPRHRSPHDDRWGLPRRPRLLHPLPADPPAREGPVPPGHGGPPAVLRDRDRRHRDRGGRHLPRSIERSRTSRCSFRSRSCCSCRW